MYRHYDFVWLNYEKEWVRGGFEPLKMPPHTPHNLQKFRFPTKPAPETLTQNWAPMTPDISPSTHGTTDEAYGQSEQVERWAHLKREGRGEHSRGDVAGSSSFATTSVAPPSSFRSPTATDKWGLLGDHRPGGGRSLHLQTMP